MQGLFCPGCKSLLAPGSKRCLRCGMSADGLMTSSQSCLGEAPVRKERPAPKMVDHANAEAPYMPYEPRGCQMDIITDIRTFLDEGRHVVIESGTGTGKTIVSLAATLEHASRTGKKVVYLVRTITQTDAVMKELRAISSIKEVSGVPVTGRGKSCPLFRGTDGFETLPSNILSMMCEDRRLRSQRGQAGGCRFYDRVETEMPAIERFWRSSVPSSDELDRHCEKLGVCPYEVKKRLMRKADVVAAPYIQVLDPDIRESLMANMDRSDDPSGIVIVVDEAHNFLDAARDSESFTIDRQMVDNAIDECTAFRDPRIWEDVRLEDFLKHFRACIRASANDLLGLNEKSAVIKDDSFERMMMSRFGMSRTDLESAVERTIDLGSARTEVLVERGENRVSPVEELAVRMRWWLSSGSERFVRTVNAGEDGEFLSASCIDPREISSFLNKVPGTLHMSGTLQPLDQYARVLGLGGNPRFRTYPSPFPPGNKMVLYARDVTTNYNEMRADPTMQKRIERRIAELCDAVDKNTLVFFTSYNMMRTMRPYLETHVVKPKYWEESGNQRRTADNLARFREGRNGVFFSVIGGSIAEGIDFPGEELCFAIIVGIPFPPPSKEMDEMKALFDQRYNGKGWLYTSQIPAVRKMNQAIGRLIRTETDRGAAVILDHRVSRFASSLGAVPSDDPVGDVARFFSKG